MKKLLFFIAFFATANLSYCQTYQLFSVMGLTGFEVINHELKSVAPVDLGYNIIRSFNTGSSYFYGAGINGGINLNDNDEGLVKGNVIAAAYIGGQPFDGFPAMAIGVGRNFVSNNYLLLYTLHFAPIEVVKSILPASPTYKSVIQP